MSRKEAKEMLQTRLTEDQAQDLASTDSLLDFLDDLPLAIRQASAYMHKTGITVARYLEHCCSSDAISVKLLSRDFEDRGRYETSKNPVAMTWLISFEHILKDSPRAGEYLQFICLLSERDIPISLLPRATDELEADEAIGILDAYAFVTKRQGVESIDMHRLVRLAMWNWLRKEGQSQQTYHNVIKRLDELFPFPKHENREIWMRYMPHAESVLQSDEECDDVEAISRILFNVAQALYLQGRYGAAEDMYRRTLELRDNTFGREHPRTLDSMNNLALVLDCMGMYEKASEMHREILELREMVLGKEHPDTLNSMNNLALALRNKGEYKEAERMHRETLQLRKKVLGKKHPSTLNSMNHLANALNSTYNYEEAKKIHQETLILRREVLGQEHPETLYSMGNLAIVLKNKGEYQEALETHRETLELQEKVLGKDHPETLANMNNLANVLHKMGEYEEASRIHQETLELRKKVLGESHPFTLDSMNNLALVLEKMGK